MLDTSAASGTRSAGSWENRKEDKLVSEERDTGGEEKMYERQKDQLSLSSCQS